MTQSSREEADECAEGMFLEVTAKINTLLAVTPFDGEAYSRGSEFLVELRRSIDEKYYKLHTIYSQSAGRLVRDYLRSLEEE